MTMGDEPVPGFVTPDLRDTVAIVVHHRNYHQIAATLRNLLSQGLSAENVLLVENSDEPQLQAALRASVTDLCRLLFVKNDGYGSAVNSGLDFWQSVNLTDPAFVLVATHEVMAQPHAVGALRAALLADAHAAAAGPTLIAGESVQHIWSQGGSLSPVLRLPQHHGHRLNYDSPESPAEPQPREWLDGAFVMYRYRALQGHRFDESFFMYMEETDLHLRLGRSGSTIVWVPQAVVWQSSHGTPNYRFARNLRLLYRRSGRRALGMIAVPLAVARRSAREVVHRTGFSPLWSLARGMVSRLPSALGVRSVPNVHIINPLGGALAHYTLELLDLLKMEGLSVREFALLEPSFSHSGPRKWLVGYISVLWRARRTRTPDTKLIVTWPVLGYLDLLVVGLVYGRGASVLMHDPQPLVKAIGYGALSRFVARPFGKRVALVVHSDVAGAVVDAQKMGSNKTKLPHPIFAPERGQVMVAEPGARPVVRVLGQFKPDRDLNALREMGEYLGDTMTLEIWGRGWPLVPGWAVTEGFVSEETLRNLTRTADAVVIPYTRFFQSGIAIRCLEVGTPVIGTRDGSLAELLGADSKLLVDADGAERAEGWLASVHWAVKDGRHEIQQIALLARTNAERRWMAWAGLSEHWHRHDVKTTSDVRHDAERY